MKKRWLQALVACLPLLWAAAATAQSDACKTGKAGSSMVCIHRNGHCLQLQIEGQATVPFVADAALAKRLAAMRIHEPVCWQLVAPVAAGFRAEAQAGGLWPEWLGQLESIGVGLYALDDFDAALDSRLDRLNGMDMQADGYRNGTWQLKSERELRPGRYLAVFRVHGSGNWDRQGVMLQIDPQLKPMAAKPGTKP